MEGDPIPTRFLLSPALLGLILEEERMLQASFSPPFPAADLAGPWPSLAAYPPLPLPPPEQQFHPEYPKLEKMTTEEGLSVSAGAADHELTSRKRPLPGFFHRLPALQSLQSATGGVEWSPGGSSSAAGPFQKRFRSCSTSCGSSSAPSPSSPLPPAPSPAPLLVAPSASAKQPRAATAIPPNVRARLRRKGISERTRLLAKLMPWERPMDTSAMLEGAHGYIKFLEAQVAALQCMPVESRFGDSPPPPPHHAAAAAAVGGMPFRGLEELNRKQLLQVMVRSPLVQDKLCARGLCVFSAEQVALIRQALERKQKQQLLLQQMTLASSSTVSD